MKTRNNPPHKVVRGINVGFKVNPELTDTAICLLSRNYKGINNFGMTAVVEYYVEEDTDTDFSG